MIYSMTAFARAHIQADWGQATWEVRTVNHRYLDMGLRLPEPFREWEPAIREKIANHTLHRGKIDCQLSFAPGSALNQSLNINTRLVDQLIQASDAIAGRMSVSATPKPTDLLRMPNVLQAAPLDIAPLKVPVLAALNDCLDQVVHMREKEGQALSDAIRQRLQSIEAQVAILVPQLPDFLNILREKMLKRLADMDVASDPQRIEQEMALLIQKADVAEEIDRLKAHVIAVTDLLDQGGAVGRKLDFLMQELNREANTLASKSSNIVATQTAVELKVLIEQMREQVQNIV